MVKELVRPEIKGLVAYDAKHYENVIKMDANENPYPFPEEVMTKLCSQLKDVGLPRYPDPGAEKLREKLAEYTGVAKAGIMVGNGSDELIQLILLAFGAGGTSLITPPTFVMYKISSIITGSNSVEIPLNEEFGINWVEVKAKAKDPNTKVIFICSPNNPTGNTVSVEEVEGLLQETSALVVLDEAYYEFAKKTGVALLEKYQNLVILRTFSKAFGMAGLRVGYLLTGTEVMQELAKVKPPYNLNSFSQKAAEVALENLKPFQANIEKILEERDVLFKELADIEGIEIFPTEANFILFRTKLPASDIFGGLLAKGVLIRNMSGGSLNNCLRVTVGTREENQTFLAALKEILA